MRVCYLHCSYGLVREFAYCWLHGEALITHQRVAPRILVSIGYVDLIKRVYIVAFVLLFVNELVACICSHASKFSLMQPCFTKTPPMLFSTEF